MSGFVEWQLPTQRIGKRTLVYQRTASTNDRAAERASDPTADGLVILAREQTAGRGQHGRSWQCPPSAGVLLSVLLFPPPELRRPAVLTAWAAVAVCETILRASNLQAKIKWPNDVLIRGRKVCGILSELRVADCELRIGEKPETRWAAIVGIGLNVNQPAEAFAAPGLEQGTSLSLAAQKGFTSDDLARLLIHQLDEEYSHLCTGDLAALESCWKWRIGLLGRQVRVECTDAGHQGRLRDLTFEGLELEQRNGATLRLRPELVQHIIALS